MQKLLEGAGAKDVSIDFDAKTATVHVPEAMDEAALTKAVASTEKYSAKVHQ